MRRDDDDDDYYVVHYVRTFLLLSHVRLEKREIKLIAFVRTLLPDVVVHVFNSLFSFSREFSRALDFRLHIKCMF